MSHDDEVNALASKTFYIIVAGTVVFFALALFIYI